MSKTHLGDEEVDGVAVNEVRGMLREMVQRRSTSAGDRERAMRRIEAEYGIGYWTTWGWLYKPPAVVTMGFYNHVKGAYLAMLEGCVKRDLARLRNEAAISNDPSDLESLETEARNLLADIQAKKEAVTF